jgi:hypothetical protein
MKPPNLKTPEDYRNFMRSEQGADLKPGSDEERFVMDGFKKASKARAEQFSGTSRENPGAMADELKSVEDGSLGVVRSHDAELAHQQARIKVTGPNSTDHPEQIQVSHEPSHAGVGAGPEIRAS